MKYVFFAFEPYPYPLVKHLIDEGNEVIVGAIKSTSELGIPGNRDTETPKFKAQRQSIHDGLVEKKPFGVVLKMLASVPKDKQDDYFVFFDHSNLYNISETVLKLGFKNGLFPTKWYYRMEKERALAKTFVETHYPDIKVADSFDFKRVADGIAHLNKHSDKVYVLKSNGNYGKTIVPKTDDPEKAKEMIEEALEGDKKGYETGGFLLEEKIPNCMEVTPIMVFYNGEYVYSLVEFENKEFGAGNIGAQKGGSQILNVKTPFDCELNRMAFPKIVHQLAKKQPGLSIFDMGLLYDGENFYFTEFCAMRYGWDGCFSEVVMRDDGRPFVSSYFEDIIAGKNPVVNTYGASVRLFNLNGNGEETGAPEDGIPVKYDDAVEDNLFLYLIRKAKPSEDEDADEDSVKGEIDLVSVGGYDLLGVATGASEVLETAVSRAYGVAEGVSFEKLYYRPMFDFLSLSYKSSIPNRLAAIRPFIEESEDED